MAPPRPSSAPVDSTLPLLGAGRDAEPAAAARRVADHVEVDLAVGDAALLGDRPEAVEHRACDHQVGHDELGPLGREGRTAGTRHDACTRRQADLRVDLDQVAVDAVPIAAVDERRAPSD